MRTYFLTLALIVFFASAASSQDNTFDAGLAALNRGHYATAMRAWIRMANDGVPQAQNNVGHLYEKGFGVAQNYTTAMKWYKLAADQGLSRAQHNVGLLYYSGYGVELNYREAVKWFKLATQQGLAESQYQLAVAYLQGQGVTMDYKFAKHWFLESAKQGYANAQFMYAYMLQAGDMGEPDPLKALVWSEVAQRNGKKEAMEDIGALSKL